MYMQYKFTCFLIRIADNRLFQVISIICFPGLHDDDNRLIENRHVNTYPGLFCFDIATGNPGYQKVNSGFGWLSKV